MEQAVGTELNDDVVNVVGGVLLWPWYGWAGCSGGSSGSGLLLLLFVLPFKEPLLVLLQCLVSSGGGRGVVWAKLEA